MSDDERRSSPIRQKPVQVCRLSRIAATRFTFRELVTFLESHRPVLTKSAFDELIASYNSRVDTATTSGAAGQYSAYQLVRLLVPSLDQRRCRLTKRMIKTSLETFINTPLDTRGLNAARCAAIVDASRNTYSTAITIDSLNKQLDMIAYKCAKRHHIIERLCRSMDKKELHYLFMILLDEISDYLAGDHVIRELEETTHGRSKLLSFLHPEANSLLAAGMSLQALSNGAQQATILGDSFGEIMMLGHGIKAMLLARINCDGEDFVKVIKHCGRPFYLETKFDGEHFLLHRINKGESYMWYSRKGTDYSEQLGGNKDTDFSERIHSHFNQDVDNCILDGELVVYDTELKRIIGKNRRADSGIVYDVKSLRDTARYCRAFVLLDLLFYNGESLLDKPLHERLNVLKSSIFTSTQPSTVQIAEQTEAYKVDEFRKFYMEHLKRGEEGVVIKGKNIKYVCGSRAIKYGAFKCKPDYGTQLTMDLGVVGICYNLTNKTTVRSFICVARLDTGDYNYVCKVSANTRKEDYEAIITAMKIEHEFTTERPDWFKGIFERKSVRFCKEDYIQVVEVKASGNINGHLQFARLAGLRLDKLPEEIENYADVHKYEVRLRDQKRLTSEDTYILQQAKYRRTAINTNVDKDDTAVSTVLDNVCVWVIDDTPNHDALRACKKKLANVGAKLIANYLPKVQFAVSLNPGGMKTQMQIRRDNIHIVSSAWIDRCYATGHLLEWKNDEMVHRTLGVSSTPFNLFNLRDEDQVSIGSSNGPAHATVNLNVGGELRHEDLVEQDDDPPLFTAFVFHAPSVDGSKLSEEYAQKIAINNGRLSEELNENITHMIFEKKYPFDTDPNKLLNWLDEHEWNCVLTDQSWIDEAIHYNNRYVDSVRLPELRTSRYFVPPTAPQNY